MKKTLSLLLCISLFCTMCIGCSSGSSAEAGDEDSDRIKLTLACWMSNWELEADVEYFNSLQDEYEVEILAFYDSQNPDTNFDTAMQRMNIALMTSEVADIFYLNSMDTASMINAGRLADLYPLMEADENFNTDNYFMNILELHEQDGALYEFFKYFQIGALCGPEPIMGERRSWTIDEYLNFASEVDLNEGELLCGNGREAMLSFLVQFALEDFIDMDTGTCRFDTPEFEKVLEFAASFPERNMEGLLSTSWFDGVSEYIYYKDNYGVAPRYVGHPSNYSAGPCAMALYSYGISEYTQYRETAWDFIMAIIDPNKPVLSMSADTGIPLRKDVFLDELERSMLDADNENSLIHGWTNGQGKSYEPLTQEDVDYIYNLVTTIKDSRFRNKSIDDIIWEEAKAFFAGDKTVGETVALIQSRVSLYLGELS